MSRIQVIPIIKRDSQFKQA